MTLTFIPEGSGPSVVTPGLVPYDFQLALLTGHGTTQKALRSLLYLSLSAEQLSTFPSNEDAHQPVHNRPSLPADSEAQGALSGRVAVFTPSPWTLCDLVEALLPLE